MNIRLTISASIATVIITGLIPLFHGPLEVDASGGNLIKTVSGLRGSLECEVDRVRYSTTLSFSVEDIRSSNPSAIGVIKIHTTSPNPMGQTDFDGKITKLRVGISDFSISSQIDGLCQRSPDRVQLIGTLHGSCNKSGNIFLIGGNGLPGSSTDTGTFNFNRGDIQCQSGSGVGSSSNGVCVTGTDKNDNLIDTSGNDCIDGKGGNYKIAGLQGNDKLNGGDGNDEMTGGSGADSFQCGAANDEITDFKASEGDKKTNDCEQF
jgi:Ca2+-binding RTX toxin-like protein